MAGTLFKNTVLNTTQEPEVEGLWGSISEEIRTNAKTALLQTLATDEPLVRNATAMCIAAIAKLELPQGQWPDIIQNMCTNARNEDGNIRLASLKTLAYICEEVACKDISEADFQLILSALIQRLEADTGKESEIETEICMEALLNSIEYTKPFFNQGNGHIIMGPILKSTVRPGSEDIRVSAFQCLVEVSDFYDHLEPFISQIKEVCQKVLSEPDVEDVRKQAFEVISKIADEDTFRRDFSSETAECKSYISAFKDMLELVLQNMLMIDADEDSFDSETLDAA